ncbi:Sulfate permease [Chitinispirillum alkaliphilum]|nr:Sulfate permease [Chitinispirillum alkaliphilum]
MLRPIILDSFKNYSRTNFFADITSGIIVGIVAIPLAIAFAIASGVTPDKGLVTAVIAGFMISLLGGSKVQISGPTGAFVVILYGIVQQHGVEGLATATLMAGILLLIMGITGLGSLIKFIPFPVVVGFTSGIAVIIFTSQIRDLFGLPLENVPSGFHEKWILYIRSLGSVNLHAMIIAAGSLLILVLWTKVSKKIPASLIVIFFSVAISQILGLDVETIGSRFGSIPSMIPAPVIPDLDFQTLKALISPAISIALLGGIEALLSAVVADGMTDDKHRSNIELVAQGIANVITPIFGGIPATGAIARTATNIKNGGRTPVAGIVHALVILMIMVFLGRWVVYIPLAALAAILVIVAYHMSEWRTFAVLLKSPRSDIAVLITTFLLTVIADLTVAIQLGVALSVVLFMRRLVVVSGIEALKTELLDEKAENTGETELLDEKPPIPEGVDIYEVKGPFFFGTAFRFEEALGAIGENDSEVLILGMRNVPFIDSTGLNTLRRFSQACRKHNVNLILSGIQSEALGNLKKAGLNHNIGHENIHPDFNSAMKRAKEVLYAKTIDSHPTSYSSKETV